MDRNEFFNPHYHYYGEVKPENLVFNANLQEFSQRVGFLCNLQTGGKLSPQDVYEQIQTLWEQLKFSKESLGIGKDPFR
ncbi:MAG TPA: hypothetical protein V6D07_01430 [Trichocoleus sp.]